MGFTGVVFTKGANSVTLEEVPEYGYERSLEKAQAYGRTAGGTLYVYDKGVTLRRWLLRFKGLSATEKTNLYNFFNNAPGDTPAGVDGMENTFTYTDENSNTYTAQFLTPILSFEKVVDDAWNVTFELELS